MTCHLSMYSSSFPMQMRLFTRTLRRPVVMHTWRILGSSADLRDWRSRRPRQIKMLIREI